MYFKIYVICQDKISVYQSTEYETSDASLLDKNKFSLKITTTDGEILRFENVRFVESRSGTVIFERDEIFSGIGMGPITTRIEISI